MNLSKSSLIVVGGGFYQKPIIKTARSKGYYVIVVDRNKNAPGAVLADNHVCCSAHDSDLTLEKILEILPKAPSVKGVLSGGGRGCVYTAAVLAKYLNLPGIEPNAANVLSSKKLLRKRIFDLKLNSAKYKLVESVEEIFDMLDSTPLVLKPITTSGACGISLIKYKEDIIKAWNYTRRFSAKSPLIVEEYIAGIDVNVFSVAQNGDFVQNIILDHSIDEENNFGNVYMFSYPSVLSKTMCDQVVTFAKQSFKLLCMNTGPCEIELRVSKSGKIQVIEVEANIPGCFIADYLIPEGAGLDFISASIDSVVGNKMAKHKLEKREKTILFLNNKIAFNLIKKHPNIRTKRLEGSRDGCLVDTRFNNHPIL